MDHVQQLMMKQPGLLLAQMHPNSVQLPAGHFGASAHNAMTVVPSQMKPIRQYAPIPGNGALSQQDIDYHVISYQQMMQMLPEPKPVGRIDAGVLSNGHAYAPFSPGQFLLFPSKSSYILYFTHHYFSRDNLIRDAKFVSMLTRGCTMPLSKLIEAPRLVAIKATQEEVAEALVRSEIVCIENIEDGLRGVCRRDRFPVQNQSFPTSGYLEATSTVPIQSMENSSSPLAFSMQHSDTEGQLGKILFISTNPKTCLPASAEQPVYTISAPRCVGNLVSSASSPAVSTRSSSRLSPSVTKPVVTGNLDTISEDAFNTAMNAACVSPANRSLQSMWASHMIPVSQANYPTPLNTESNQITHGVVYSNSQAAYNHHMNFTSLPPTDLSHMQVLPIRPSAAALGPYLLNQVGHNNNARYPVNYGPVSSTPVTLAVAAAALANQSPSFGNPLLTTPPTQLSHYHQPTNVAIAAAYAAVAQQQQQQQQQQHTAYLHASMPQNLQTQGHGLQPLSMAAQAPFQPVCYPPHSLPFPAHFQRLPMQRLPHGSTAVYQMPAYPLYHHPHQTVMSTNPNQMTPDLDNKTEMNSVFPPPNAVAHPNISCPMVVPHNVQFHHHPHHPAAVLNANHLVDSRLATAAANLHIQRSNDSTSTATAFQYPYAQVTLSPSKATAAVSVPRKTDSHLTTVDGEQSETVLKYLGPDLNANTIEADNSETVLTGHACQSAIMQQGEQTDTCPITRSAEETEKSSDKAPNNSSSTDDSEDSASSGIGEMTSAQSGNTSDARTNSSCTLTDQTNNLVSCSPAIGRPRSRVADIASSPKSTT